MAGKTIVPFATSDGSDMGKTNERLLPSCNGAKLLDGASFPYIVKIIYTANGQEFIKNKWLGAGLPVPEIGS